jgi:L-lactate utilization protein LutC
VHGAATLSPMTTTATTDRFTALPTDAVLAATAAALEERGASVEIVDDLEAARDAALARIPEGSSVMTNTSVTLRETGIAKTVDGNGPFESARNRLLALDRETQLKEIKAVAAQVDFALGSVHAITRDGILVVASATGSQLAPFAWVAPKVIFVVGAQKLVPDLEAARERVFAYSLPLEDARAVAAYGRHSRVGKILEIHRDDPGRIHVVLIRRVVGF